MEKVKVLLVDDHAIVREGMKMIFETFNSFEIIGEASDGLDALSVLTKLNPDIILLDIAMPKMDGITFLKALKDRKMNIPVVVLTTMDEQEKIKEAIRSGAKSYLLKDASRDVLKRTVEAALNNEMLLTTNIQGKLLNSIDSDDSSSYEDFGLTERELYILTEVAQGETNKSIAIDLNVSERTVKAHLTNLYAKMDVASRSEAVAKALANKIIHI